MDISRGIKMSRITTLPGLALCISLMVIASGCAGPTASSPEKIQQALSAGSSGSVNSYVLGATDVVRVSVWRNEDLSISVPIRPDGKISVPLIGDVQAGGKASGLSLPNISGNPRSAWW